MYLTTLEQRCRFIAERLERVHARLLRTAPINDEELRSLGPNLRRYCEASRNMANNIRRRIAKAREALLDTGDLPKAAANED